MTLEDYMMKRRWTVLLYVIMFLLLMLKIILLPFLLIDWLVFSRPKRKLKERRI